MADVIVCSEPFVTIGRHDLGVRWCFGCRSRQRYWETIHAPADQMSWYGPHASWACEGCGKDAALFPGFVRDHGEV